MKHFRELIYSFILCAVCNVSFAATAEAADKAVIDQLHKQITEYYISEPFDDDLVTEHLKTFNEHGMWPDIDYKSRQKGSWPTIAHLSRLRDMARSYANPKSRYHGKADLKNKIVMGLDNWLTHDYVNTNWWTRRIGIPVSALPTFFLLGDELPEKTRQRALETILNRTGIQGTGQNLVWAASIMLMRGVLTEDGEMVQKSSDAIQNEISVTTKEGIQADGTYHQHGPQLQVGNYGLIYTITMVKFAQMLRDTPFAFGPEKVAILRNMMLESMAWFYWKGNWDLSACGRQVGENTQNGKASMVQAALLDMAKVDVAHAARYDIAKYPLHGFKGFWRSDFAVARRPGWYASVRMCSLRVAGTETCNSENVLGVHAADGVLLHYRSGREYENIQPIWDWKRLPGTTCDQGMKDLGPTRGRTRNKSDFVGTVGDGSNGAAAMHYKRYDLSAKKAWFVFQDRIVCLGAEIQGETRGPVFTSVEQCWAADEAQSSAGKLTRGEIKIDAGGWIRHQGVGYRLMTGATATSRDYKGDWKRIFPAWDVGKAEGEMFSLWIDHGQSPKGAHYAYTIFPDTGEGEVDAPAANILSNTGALQAVELNGDLSAVFHKPGEISIGDTKISVDQPCLLLRRDGKLFISEPTKKLTEINVTQGAKTILVKLPEKEMAGSTVSVQ